MNLHVVRAIFRRNLVSYFSNPTGYVFICVFVLLSGVAAFWPNEFFNANLASFDQLNRYLPYIMLVFIPAITMSIWADERRQGTDELLLTIPAGDLDVVVGKYLAAVAIFSVALAFSFTNIAVLRFLGQPDFGLLFGTYCGYWLVGLAMLAIGMAASFLTSNLTVGFTLGAIFNAPLVFADSADVILPQQWAVAVKHWSLAEQFRDFGRGVVSGSSIVYFLLIVVVMLYLSMVLIGRRHWAGGRDGTSLAGHYAARAVALVAIAVGLVLISARHDARLDVTYERLSSLAPQTKKLLASLDGKRPVQIEAFISPEVPESYVRTRLDLLNMLREFQARSGGKIRVVYNNAEQYSAAAKRAEEQYGIKAQQVASRTRGSMNIDSIYLGVAFTCGLDKVVVPFFDRGVPVEYELIRSIATVSGEKRKRIGIVQTDAKLQAEFDMQTMSPGRNELIVEELEKQYDIVQVNADNPITERYDVLLAVQPSSLTPPQMQNFIAAVSSGQPTAIFEDPFPYLDPSVPATSQPRRPRGGGGMFAMNQAPPQPKGDINQLWQLLGIDFGGTKVVRQDYNPYPKVGQFPPEFVFVDKGEKEGGKPFNDADLISSKLQQMLFLFPGSVRQQNASKLEFTPLVRTGDNTGTVDYSQILEPSMFGPGQLNPARRPHRTHEEYVLAVHIRGKVSPLPAAASGSMGGLPPGHPPFPSENLPMADEGSPDKPADSAPGDSVPPDSAPADSGDSKAEAPAADETQPPAGETQPPEGETKAPAEGAAPAESGTVTAEPAKAAEPQTPKEAELNVVLVADIDPLYSAFVALRNRGDDPDAEVNLQLDNVAFVLNTLDVLAGDDRFVEIRKRRPQHRSLTTVEEQTQQARDDASKAREDFIEEFDKGRQAAQQELDNKIAELQKRKDIDPLQMRLEVETVRRTEERRLEAKMEQLKTERDDKIKDTERDLALNVRSVQNRYKFLAVAIPPLFPLALGGVIFFSRRAREREGVAKSRLR